MSDINDRLDRIETAVRYLASVAGEETTTGSFLNPSPPPKSEAEMLADLANSLPQEVFDAAGECHEAGSFKADTDGRGVEYRYRATLGGCGRGYSLVTRFRTVILGVMARYVGSEPGASVWRREENIGYTDSFGDCSHFAPNLLTAYRDCCLAIAAKRKEVSDV